MLKVFTRSISGIYDSRAADGQPGTLLAGSNDRKQVTDLRPPLALAWGERCGDLPAALVLWSGTGWQDGRG